jgi:hypothetical protein
LDNKHIKANASQNEFFALKEFLLKTFYGHIFAELTETFFEIKSQPFTGIKNSRNLDIP